MHIWLVASCNTEVAILQLNVTSYVATLVLMYLFHCGERHCHVKLTCVQYS